MGMDGRLSCILGLLFVRGMLLSSVGGGEEHLPRELVDAFLTLISSSEDDEFFRARGNGETGTTLDDPPIFRRAEGSDGEAGLITGLESRRGREILRVLGRIEVIKFFLGGIIISYDG